MLVIDDTLMHKIGNIYKKIKDFGTKISMILGVLIRYLQPLDISIKKPFKEELKIYLLSIAWSKKKSIKSISRRFNKLGYRSIVYWQIISKNDQQII